MHAASFTFNADGTFAYVPEPGFEGVDTFTFQVTDDGTGFDLSSTPRGSGLNNMLDRLSALGGDVTVESAPGRGTTIRGRVPLAGAPAPAEVVR